MAKEHGPPLGTNEHKTFKEVKIASKLYRDNCKTGFKGGFWNAHHVVPCVSLQSSLSEFLTTRDPEYKLALAFFTNWDVNEGYNLFGLPAFTTYKVVFDAMKAKTRRITAGPPIWFKGKTNIRLPSMRPRYPIHIPSDWGHKIYEDNVKTDLDDVWTKLKVRDENHDPVVPADLQGAIQAISNNYRGKLARKTGQTIEDWENEEFGQFMMAE